MLVFVAYSAKMAGLRSSIVGGCRGYQAVLARLCSSVVLVPVDVVGQTTSTEFSVSNVGAVVF